MKWLKAVALSMGKTIGLTIVFMLVSMAGLYWWSTRKPHVEPNSTLYVELDRPLVEAPTSAPTTIINLLSGSRPPELTSLLVADAIRAAATDPRIARVAIDLDRYAPAGSETAQELVAAIGAVRRAGKPVIAYAANFDRQSYQIAAAAQKRYVSPLGMVDLSGPEIGQIYVGELLKKLGVEIRIAKAGRYKSAVEPFELGRMSTDARASLEGLVTGHRATFLQQAAQLRGMNPGALERAIAGVTGQAVANGGDLTRAAASLGLIDGSTTAPALENWSLGRSPAATPLRAVREAPGVVDIDDWQRAAEVRQCDTRRREDGRGGLVAIAPLSGPITMDERAIGAITPVRTVELLRKLRHSPRTAAVVLRIDSPGGDAQAAEIIRQEVLALRRAGIPVIASLGNTAASGGYWIASAADTIVAGRYTTTGSIGAFALLANVNRLATGNAINPQVVRAGSAPITPNLIERPTNEQLALLDAGIAGVYSRFVAIVAEARDLPRTEVERIAEGRVWTGPQAVQLKLADRLGTLSEAIAIAAKAGGTSPDCKALLPRQVTLQEALRMATQGAGGVSSRLAAWALGAPLAPAPAVDRLLGMQAMVEREAGRPMTWCASCEALR